ncbi:MAG: 50S ribosomal protein L6 [archaeon]|jgi:large subunit ribosomal protein L6
MKKTEKIVAKEKSVKKELKNTIVKFPSDIKVAVGLQNVTFEKSGKKTDISFNPVYISVKLLNGEVELTPKNKKKTTKAVINTTEKHMINAIKGLDHEYVYKLAIVYSHFPITVKAEGNEIIISNFLGEKKPRKTRILPGCKVEVKGKDIIVRSHNKYNAGQTAGNIEKTTRVVGKDFRIFDDGCYIVEKAKHE